MSHQHASVTDLMPSHVPSSAWNYAHGHRLQRRTTARATQRSAAWNARSGRSGLQVNNTARVEAQDPGEITGGLLFTPVQRRL